MRIRRAAVAGSWWASQLGNCFRFPEVMPGDIVTPCFSRHCRDAENCDDPAPEEPVELELAVAAELAPHPVSTSAAAPRRCLPLGIRIKEFLS